MPGWGFAVPASISDIRQLLRVQVLPKAADRTEVRLYPEMAEQFKRNVMVAQTPAPR